MASYVVQIERQQSLDARRAVEQHPHQGQVV
jgi:hypothetical protein